MTRHDVDCPCWACVRFWLGVSLSCCALGIFALAFATAPVSAADHGAPASMSPAMRERREKAAIATDSFIVGEDRAVHIRHFDLIYMPTGVTHTTTHGTYIECITLGPDTEEIGTTAWKRVRP